MTDQEMLDAMQHFDLSIHQLQTADMTDEECHLTKFTQKNLQKLLNWADWDATFNAQLDAHHESGIYGLPIPHPMTSLDGG